MAQTTEKECDSIQRQQGVQNAGICAIVYIDDRSYLVSGKDGLGMIGFFPTF